LAITLVGGANEKAAERLLLQPTGGIIGISQVADIEKFASDGVLTSLLCDGKTGFPFSTLKDFSTTTIGMHSL